MPAPLKEIPLLLECLRPSPDARRVAGLAARADWERLVAFASAGGLLPLLHAQLSAVCPDAVPPTVQETLRAAFLRNTQRNLRLTGELLDVLDGLDRAGVRALPFKGPALAWSIYESPGMREFSDLDVLVRREDFANAQGILAERGYETGAGQIPAAFFDSNTELPLRHRKTGIQIDLHWRPVAGLFGLVETEFFWSSLAPVEIAGRTVQNFSPERTFLYLCLHGGGHGWRSLKWLSDLAHLAASSPLDWQRILADAGSRRITRYALLGLALAEKLLGLECPAQISLGDIRSRRVYSQARAHALEGWPQEGRFREMVFQWPLLERGHDRLALLQAMFQPTPADLGAVKLPSSFSGLYYGVRAVRLARACLPK